MDTGAVESKQSDLETVRKVTDGYHYYPRIFENGKPVGRIWDSETEGAPERPNFARIAKESNNNVRDALMTLEVQIMGA